MIKLVLLGAGRHSQKDHLPSLARCLSEHPVELELTALCDLRKEHAQAIAAKYAFARVYTDLKEMLEKEQPDGCIAVTPLSVTAQIAAQVMRAGVPLLMEKPPGATVDEAREVVNLVERTNARVMVSMNRRFDRALRVALDWWGDRPLEYLRATIGRSGRREPCFMQYTAIHSVDAMRAIGGEVQSYSVEVRDVSGVEWFIVRLTFEGGALGLLEVLPTGGSIIEAYDLFGADCRSLTRAGACDSGEVFCWEDSKLVVEDEPAKGMPYCVRSGTYDETVEFISALRENRMPHPTPSEVLQSVEISHDIAEGIFGWSESPSA